MSSSERLGAYEMFWRDKSSALGRVLLSMAQAQLQVLQAQKDVAERNAELREQQLIAEVVKPAQAEAQKTTILAGAEAERIQILAAAAASNNRVALDRMLIEQLPEIVKSAAMGLSNANVTVLNGADGLGDIAASLVGQGSAIFEAVRKGFQGGAPGSNSTSQPKPTINAPELNS